MIDWMKQDDAEVRDEYAPEGEPEVKVGNPDEAAEYSEPPEGAHQTVGMSTDEPVHVTWTAVFDGRREKKDRVFYLNALDASRVREGDYGPIKPLMVEAEGGLVKSRMHVKVS